MYSGVRGTYGGRTMWYELTVAVLNVAAFVGVVVMTLRSR